MQLKEGFFEANGVRLNYVEGPDNGPPLLLIPGQSSTWQSYEPVFPGLCIHFHVYAVSIRGHGKSDRTPGSYDFNTIGQDLAFFLEGVVKDPALVAGNSSGGLIGLWLSVNRAELVKGLILEDAPLFSADWPRIKNEFVYEILTKTANYLGKKSGPDYKEFFNNIKRPLRNGKIKQMPPWLSNALAWLVINQERSSARLILSMLPRSLRLLLQILPSFDPDFSRAWVDGRIYQGLDHAEALKRIKVPLLILHANWFRSEKGLVGAMDDEDVKKARFLAPHAQYLRMDTEHVIHSGRPAEFVSAIGKFYGTIKDSGSRNVSTL